MLLARLYDTALMSAGQRKTCCHCGYTNAEEDPGGDSVDSDSDSESSSSSSSSNSTNTVRMVRNYSHHKIARVRHGWSSDSSNDTYNSCRLGLVTPRLCLRCSTPSRCPASRCPSPRRRPSPRTPQLPAPDQPWRHTADWPELGDTQVGVVFM